MEYPNHREFFRIHYPWEERPRFVLHSSICEVIDCSERGLRFRLPPPSAPPVGAELSGRLRLRRGQEVAVQGVVVRVEEGEVALRLLEPGVSFYLILKEQIHLRRRRREREEELSDVSEAGADPG